MSTSRSMQVISAPAEGDARLAVVVREGAADLARAALLRGTGARIVAELGPELSEDAVAGWLEAHGAASAEQARRDARAFLGELAPPEGEPGASGGAGRADSSAARGTEASSGPPNGSAAARGSVPPAAWIALARAVLADGRKLRFRARGRSMRPLVPHGSLLEVESRPFERVRLGEVTLHSFPTAPLVAHRVVGRRGGALLTRGDSNARIEAVPREAYLGVVVARETGGGWKRVSSGPARWLGLATGLSYRVAVGLARTLVLRPLRATYAGHSVLRAFLRGLLRLASASLLFLERAAIRARRPPDVLRAALLSTAEKDADRTRLYARSAIQEFTALEENVRSGLTLLEEVCLARHPLPPGQALVLGCGPGRECLVLARAGFDVTGIDREAGMLVRARQLAREAGLAIRYLPGEASDFEVEGGPFDLVVIFSGLYNMVLPRERRVRMLAAARRHLRPGGSVLVTFLSAYVHPHEEPAPGGKHVLEAMNPDHERGDLYLLNEAVHVFPRGEDVAEEAAEAGLETVDLFRDQRAYDRPAGQVRGYAVLRRPA